MVVCFFVKQSSSILEHLEIPNKISTHQIKISLPNLCLRKHFLEKYLFLSVLLVVALNSNLKHHQFFLCLQHLITIQNKFPSPSQFLHSHSCLPVYDLQIHLLLFKMCTIYNFCKPVAPLIYKGVAKELGRWETSGM